MMLPSLSCDACEALLPGYVLNALEPEETVAVDVHLRLCVNCQTSLGECAAVIGRLAEGITLQEPPADLRQRVMTAVSAELAAAPPAWSERLYASWRQLWATPWPITLTLAYTVLVLGVTWWLWQARQDVARDRMSGQMALGYDLPHQAVALMASPGSHRVFLQAEAGEARGVLLFEASTRNAVLVGQALPPLPPDRVYQLWLIRNGTRDSGGIFQVNDHGDGTLLISAPQPMHAYRAAGITEEPAGGSPGPTSPRLIGAPLEIKQ